MANRASSADHLRTIRIRALLAADGVVERYQRKVRIDREADCWIWTAAVGPGGYGVFKLARGITRQAHRIAHAIHRCEPGEMWVLHSCDNPLCVNPAHLRLGTHQDNIDDQRRTREEKDALANAQWLAIQRVQHDAFLAQEIAA